MLFSLYLVLLHVSASFGRCPTSLVYQAPLGTWFENVAARFSGVLLVTSLNSPGGMYSLDPSLEHPILEPIFPSFPGVKSTLGIVETTADIFYIIGNNFSLSPDTLGVMSGTNAIFKVNLTDTQEPSLTLLTTMPEAKFLNGLTTHPSNPVMLLAADSALGAIWSIDTLTGAYDIISQDEQMFPSPSPPSTFKEGINGIHTYDSDPAHVYFTNSQRRTFSRLPLTRTAHNREHPTAPNATIIVASLNEQVVKPQWDDFAFDRFGTAYVATEAGNSIQMIPQDGGEVVIIAGDLNSTAIAEPTSAVFGRSQRDRDVLYVVTSGGLGFPVYVDGVPTRVGAQIVAVDLGKCLGWMS